MEGGLSGTLTLFMTSPFMTDDDWKLSRSVKISISSWCCICLPPASVDVLRKTTADWLCRVCDSSVFVARKLLKPPGVRRAASAGAPPALCSQILRLYEVWHKTLKNINSLKMWWSRTRSCFCYRAELCCFTETRFRGLMFTAEDAWLVWTTKLTTKQTLCPDSMKKKILSSYIFMIFLFYQQNGGFVR